METLKKSNIMSEEDINLFLSLIPENKKIVVDELLAEGCLCESLLTNFMSFVTGNTFTFKSKICIELVDGLTKQVEKPIDLEGDRIKFMNKWKEIFDDSTIKEFEKLIQKYNIDYKR